MKYSFLLTLLLLLFFLAGCSESEDNDSFRLTLDASGEIKVIPDMARFTVKVNCLHDSISMSNKCLTEKLDTVFSILDDVNIDENDYHSSNVTLDKEYAWEDKKQTFKGYRSTSTIEITVNDLDDLNRLLGKMMVHSDLSISGLTYSHSGISELENDAYIQALKNAMTLAKRIKKESGGDEVEIVEINNTRGPIITDNNMMLRSEAAAPKAGPLDMNIGYLVLRKDIRVQFRITH